jgi:hypothetical protein
MADEMFTYDSVDTTRWGWERPSGYDTIDWLQSNETDVPTACPGCDRWLTGPDSRKCGLCWRCRR